MYGILHAGLSRKNPCVLLKPFLSRGVTVSRAAFGLLRGLRSNGKPLCSDIFHVIWAPWFIWLHWLTLSLSRPLRSGKVVPAWPSGGEGAVSEVLSGSTDAVGGAPVSAGEGCADLKPFCYRAGSPTEPWGLRLLGKGIPAILPLLSASCPEVSSQLTTFTTFQTSL